MTLVATRKSFYLKTRLVRFVVGCVLNRAVEQLQRHPMNNGGKASKKTDETPACIIILEKRIRFVFSEPFLRYLSKYVNHATWKNVSPYYTRRCSENAYSIRRQSRNVTNRIPKHTVAILYGILLV